MAARRVMVTGMGAVTPLGMGARGAWGKILEGKSGVKAVVDEDIVGLKLKSKVAASIPKECKDELLASRKPAFVAYALSAAKEAFQDANFVPKTETEKLRTGIAIGSGIGNVEEIAKATRIMDSRGPRKISPYFVPNILVNMAAGYVSLEHDLQGPNHACSTACATGANAIGDAFRLIRNGDADVMVCGGTEDGVSPLSMAGFMQMRALSTSYNTTPEKASRPFDKGRDGFVIGEGAGVLILESLDHARKRGAKCYAEIVGYGLSADAHHITAPSPDGRGAQACMQAAIREADIDVGEIGYVNAHATSTPLGDLVEASAISKVFLNNMPLVSSTKGATGHTLGAAGAIEAIFTILALSEGKLPPTLNLDNPEANTMGWNEDKTLPPLRHVHETISVDLEAAMSNSFGFGGVNACLVFKASPSY